MKIRVSKATAEKLARPQVKPKRKKPRKPHRCRHCGSIYGCLRYLGDGQWEHFECEKGTV